MDLIAALYTLAVLLGALFFLGVISEIWLWWYPGFVMRSKRARRQARRGW